MNNFYPGQRVLLDIEIIEKGDGPIWDGIGYYEIEIQNFIDAQKADQELVIFDTPIGDSIRTNMIHVHNTTLDETFWFPRSAVLPYEISENAKNQYIHTNIIKTWCNNPSDKIQFFDGDVNTWRDISNKEGRSPTLYDASSYRIKGVYSLSNDDVYHFISFALERMKDILRNHRTAEELLQDYLTSNNLG